MARGHLHEQRDHRSMGGLLRELLGVPLHAEREGFARSEFDRLDHAVRRGGHRAQPIAQAPARLVMDMNGGVWCQAWIARHGWLSIESAYPVFDYIRPVRTGFPKMPAPREYAVAGLSGRHDTLNTLSWTGESGSSSFVPAAELKEASRLRGARLLLVTVHDNAAVPLQAKIPLTDAIRMHARQRGPDMQLVFEDPGGRELQVFTPALDGLSSTLNVGDRLLWRFIARRLGSLLVIENIECSEYRPTSSE